MTSTTPHVSKSRYALAVVLLLAAGAFAYSSGLDGPLIFDDVAISQNPSIRSLWPIWRAMRAPPGNTFAGRPIANLSFAINYAISGDDVRGFHITNVAIHLLTALILFAFLRRALRLPRVPIYLTNNADFLALAIALLWVVHPLLSEVVTYTSTRTEGLMGFFFIATFYCFVRAIESPQKVGWKIGTFICCALGMGCKEVMATAPPLLYLFDVLLVTGSFGAPLKRRPWLYVALALTIPIVPILILTQADFTAKTGEGFVATNPWTYALTESGVILHYLRLSFWPTPLTIDYADWPLAKSIADVLPQVVAVLAMAAITAYGIARRLPAAFLGGWFFLILAPTSSFIPLRSEIAAERRMYLPLIAVMVAVVAIAARFALSIRIKPLRAGIVLLVPLVATALALATWWRNFDYSSEIMIFSDALAKRPNNPRAASNLAEAFRAAGRYVEARQAYEVAVRNKPWDAHFQAMLGSLLIGENRLDDAKSHLRQAMRLDSTNAAARTDLGTVLLREGDTDGALRQYRSALSIDPKQVDALIGIADILAARGDVAEALLHLRTAMEIAPDDSSIRQKYDQLRGQIASTKAATHP